jgi:predicted AAA+ superfamily ATPase
MHEIKRTAQTSILYLLKHFPCVAVIGARQVGKTTLLKQVLPDNPFFDLEKRSDFDRISRDPDFFLSQYDQPIVIDEAQILPQLFPALRVAIDANRGQKGRYLISGSSSPQLQQRLNESLAGRIAVFELGGLTLEEAFQEKPSPFYKMVAEKQLEKLLSLKARFTSRQLLETCLHGSYPGPVLEFDNEPNAFSLWMDNYIQAYLMRDVRALFPGLNLQAFQRFIGMLSASTGQAMNYSEYASALDVSQPTIKFYFQIAHGTFIWRMLPGFHKQAVKRLIKTPRGHLRDSGLANHWLQNHDTEGFQRHPLAGRLWEGFVIEELLKGFQNHLITVEPYFYRTSNQAEIDLVLEGGFGVLPIEIKLGTITDSRKLKTLQQFLDEYHLPLGLVLDNSREPARLTKNIMQMPVGCL